MNRSVLRAAALAALVTFVFSGAAQAQVLRDADNRTVTDTAHRFVDTPGGGQSRGVAPPLSQNAAPRVFVAMALATVAILMGGTASTTQH